MSSQDEISRIDEAMSRKLPTSRVCPLCDVGQFETLRTAFSGRPRVGAAVADPIDAVGRVCVHCGFLSMHASQYLLAESL